MLALPYELLPDIVEGVVRDYLFEYFTSHGTPLPWNAISALSSVSFVMRSLVRALLSSALAIPSLEDGRLSIDPLVAIKLARDESQMSEYCLYPRPELEMRDALPVTGTFLGLYQDGTDSVEHSLWKDSPLLTLYSVIREIRFKSDLIIRRSSSVAELLPLPITFAVPLEKASALKDKRLAWPALMEGARLMACTSFIGQLAACVISLMIFRSELFGEENIDEKLSQMEALERDCLLLPPNLRWLQIERQAIVNPLNIYISGIVPALNDFLSRPVVTSDPRYDQWRLRGSRLLDAWAPLDKEIRDNPGSAPQMAPPVRHF